MNKKACISVYTNLERKKEKIRILKNDDLNSPWISTSHPIHTPFSSIFPNKPEMYSSPSSN